LFSKVLVANRGEIAVRVLGALRRLGIPSVAVYSEADRAAPHVRCADEAYAIGPAPSAQSYLNIERIVDTCRRCGATAVHPGYGFLSENASFAAACEAAGIVFIGPPAAAIRAMGLKTEARLLAQRAGVPTVPGTSEPLSGFEAARAVAAEIGYPVMLKAAAGGGGKGMRAVAGEFALEAAFRDASSEAESSFRDASVYIEKLIERPRHVEIQIIGDRHGRLIHLGERECSLQRRHQKVIEECPSPFVARHPGLRDRMGEAAIRAAAQAGYYNAGTVEFLVDEQANFYFLEMNTRLQVEHPVTEMVTGLDLVELQLHVAKGEPLPLTQEEVTWRGSAVECRVYAEDPARNFFPSPGLLTRYDPPHGPGLRLDSGVETGYTVPIDYDPMLAKLAAWGATRDQAVTRLRDGIDRFAISGIQTNLSFFAAILDDPAFRAAEIHTGFIAEWLARRTTASPGAPQEVVAALVASLAGAKPASAAASSNGSAASAWRRTGRSAQLRCSGRSAPAPAPVCLPSPAKAIPFGSRLPGRTARPTPAPPTPWKSPQAAGACSGTAPASTPSSSRPPFSWMASAWKPNRATRATGAPPTHTPPPPDPRVSPRPCPAKSSACSLAKATPWPKGRELLSSKR
jgi:acetyl-CoA carboxylase biotin carboxylase subunit